MDETDDETKYYVLVYIFFGLLFILATIATILRMINECSTYGFRGATNRFFFGYRIFNLQNEQQPLV